MRKNTLIIAGILTLALLATPVLAIEILSDTLWIASAGDKGAERELVLGTKAERVPEALGCGNQRSVRNVGVEVFPGPRIKGGDVFGFG